MSDGLQAVEHHVTFQTNISAERGGKALTDAGFRIIDVNRGAVTKLIVITRAEGAESNAITRRRIGQIVGEFGGTYAAGLEMDTGPNPRERWINRLKKRFSF